MIPRPVVDRPLPRLLAAISPSTPRIGVVLGATSIPPQYGILGRGPSAATVALNLNGCDTISVLGVQGGGKSYTVGAIVEMATAQIPRINVLEKARASVVFHYHRSEAYEPELLAATAPNAHRGEVGALFRDYGARPQALGDVLLLVPEAKVELRRQQYPGVEVAPIKFSSAELQGQGWKILLGVYDNEALYVRQISAILQEHRDALTLERLRRSLDDCAASEEFSAPIAALAAARLKLAAAYIDDSARLGAHLRPGRVVIVDLRDAWIEQGEALELFAVMMGIFATVGQGGEGALFDASQSFRKLFVLDEAHKYLHEQKLVRHVVEMIREMRHQGVTVCLASQDPISVPVIALELSTVVVLHRQTSPRWLDHERRAVIALRELDEKTLANLGPGEAMVWAQHATDRRYTVAPQKVQIRPRVTAHGGATKTAVPMRKTPTP